MHKAICRILTYGLFRANPKPSRGKYTLINFASNVQSISFSTLSPPSPIPSIQCMQQQHYRHKASHFRQYRRLHRSSCSGSETLLDYCNLFAKAAAEVAYTTCNKYKSPIDWYTIILSSSFTPTSLRTLAVAAAKSKRLNGAGIQKYIYYQQHCNLPVGSVQGRTISWRLSSDEG